MKKKNIVEKLSYGKGFYLTAAVSFCLVIVAVVLVYRTSTGMLKDILTTTNSSLTQDVRRNETDETDPRYTTDDVTTAPTTSVPATEEQETSIAATTTEREESTIPSTVPTTEAVISNDSYALPLTGEIQKEYSPDSPVYDETMGDWRVHKGIDFPAEADSEVKSIGNGKVTKVISDTNFGYIVEIDHGDFTARYCGLQQGTTVKANDRVEKGDTVGKLGTIPCEAEQESHLHFETVKNGKSIDPMQAMGIVSNAE